MSEKNELPKGWMKICLKDITLPSQNSNPQKERTGTFKYVDIEALDNQRQVIAEPKTVQVNEAPSRARVLMQSGDLLFSLVRPYLKNVAIVPDELDNEIASTAYCVRRPSSIVESKFLFYQLVQDSFINRIPTYGSSPPAARDDEFLDMQVLLPPLPEQHRIVTKLEELFSDLDAGVAALKRARANLKRYRAAVLKEAVEGKLTAEWRAKHRDVEPASVLLERILAERRSRWEAEQLAAYEAKGKTPPKGWKEKYKKPAAPDTASLPELPEGWCWATVEQLASGQNYALAIGPFGSNLKTSDYSDEGVPLVFVRNIRASLFEGLDDKYVSYEKANELNAHCVSPGDILITKMGEPPGEACLYPNDRPQAVITADCIKWSMSHLLQTPRYFVDAFATPWLQHQIGYITSGVAQQKVSLQRFRSVALPLPPREEQRVIAHIPESKQLLLAKCAQAIEESLLRATRLRQSILKRAFEGRLVPQDPADEPAGAVLEKMRSEGPVEKKSGRKGKRRQQEEELFDQ